ncbi:protein CURVATURE THYLAKOID 1B, chloroplastic [Oryza brachyantha]|uniref:protein CURVATURE THYLAKOID 1B, chloroplastic n=1 Tax=Oryza brachyantha TaxID=4533 RepID=UPI001ADC1A39|nr:protein CURVATURE THYLAKOID 1B, chloroplastic [Oryza brachyantha]
MAMATACLRLAAVPLGLAPPPPRRAPTATGVRYGLKTSRLSVAVRAADGGTGGEGSTEVPEIVRAAQDAWAKVEDKYAVTAIGVAALVGLWTAIGAIKAIDRLPLLPGVLELVGIGYTGWFTYRNLIFQPDREALVSKIKSTYKEITGSSS